MINNGGVDKQPRPRGLFPGLGVGKRPWERGLLINANIGLAYFYWREFNNEPLGKGRKCQTKWLAFFVNEGDNMTLVILQKPALC